MSTELERLGLQLEAARAERDAAREAVAEARRALEETRNEVDARTARRARERAGKQRLVAFASIAALVVTGLVVFVATTWVGAETLRGEVTEVSGDAPVAMGEACRARLEAGIMPLNGELQIDCGTLRLYGSESSGALWCETSGQRAVRCADEHGIGFDGDPRVILDRPARRLTVDDGSSWRAEITLAD